MNYKLNLEQKSAIENCSGPLLIVAGAGTGKTTVISQKIIYLINKKLARPEEILALAFNDKAAQEIQTRVDETIENSYSDMQISTFHSFGQRLLEEYGLDIGLSNNFKTLSQTESWLMVKSNLDKFNLDYYRPLGNPTKHIHELIKHFNKCKDELVSPQNYLEHAQNIKLDKDEANISERDRLSEIADAFHIYNQLLLDNNCLDFGDLIYYSVELLQTRPAILKKLQTRFKYILVDEFQDVNWAQYQLVRQIAGKLANITVVGDDDQGIYSFRGASVANIMRFKDDFKQAKEIILNKNYRSGQKILDIAYQSIQNNDPDRLENKLKINKKLLSQIKSKGLVCHTHKATNIAEAQFVAEEIIKIKNNEPLTNWQDFAILIRANNHAEPFIAALESRGIPYDFKASVGLFKQPIILDCFNFFKLVDNYHESNAVYRLLKIPFLNFSENDLQKITYNAKKSAISYYEVIKQPNRFKISMAGAKSCLNLVDLIHQGMKQSRLEKPHRILYEFLNNIGYLKYLANQEQANDLQTIKQISHLTNFFEFLQNYEQTSPNPHLAHFLSYFKDLSESGDLGSLNDKLLEATNAVNIMTVHRSKGMEFKHVFVVNLVEDRFPTRRRGDSIELPNELIKEKLPQGDSHILEERRLFYVACTRAKSSLYFTSAFDYGGVRTKKISRFLYELDFKANSNNIVKQILPQEETTIKINQNIDQEPVYIIPKIFSFSQ